MSASALPETCSQATVWLWSGHATYWGPSLQLDVHSGSVHCFALGIDSTFLVRSGGEEQSVRSALIPARTAHKVVAGDGRMVFFYIDPSAVSVERVRDQMLGHTATISYQHRAESLLISAWQDTAEPDPETLWRYLYEAVETGEMDERIRTAMRLLRSRPNENAKDIAAAVNLSSSQFLRLFALYAGTSFRRYRLWAKMCRAADAVSNGADLTTASAEAGFASPSHFSDTFRAMFGLSATQLLSGPTRIIVAESERAGLVFD